MDLYTKIPEMPFKEDPSYWNDDDEDVRSECCSAPFYPESDICTECGEHG